jgi:hypothetical protein
MSHNELKIEIQKLLDNIPDTVLEDILDVLKKIEAKTHTMPTEDYLSKIFDEDKEVLQKLAQ